MKRSILAAASAAVLASAVLATPAQAWSLPSWLGGTTSAAAPASAAKAPAELTASLPKIAASPRTDAAAPLAVSGLPNFRAVVKNAGPAVVGITVSGMRPVDNEGPAAAEQSDPFFRFFQGVPGFRMPPRNNVPFQGQGSGFIVSSDGLILTNAHVVRDAKQVTVKLTDRREFTARVLGLDTATDVAVLRVDAKGLPAVTLGDPASLQVGDWVLAIGAPYGFEQTATQGIVSAKGRSLPGDSAVPFIQTDAAVNPGNSGGPLFDAAGRVIAINAQIYSQSGGFQGLAFAIPVDVALKVSEQIVTKGRVEHARLGLVVQDLSAPLADSFGLKSPDGALVSTIVPISAAAKAGLLAGDVITSLGGQPVHTAGDVSQRIGLASPGERIAISIWRDRSERKLEATLGRAEAERSVAEAAAPHAGALGLAVRALTRNEMRQSGLDHGLVVQDVAGAAAAAGVQPGDVLLSVNGQPIRGVEQLRSVVESHPKHVALLIARDGQQIFVPLDAG